MRRYEVMDIYSLSAADAQESAMRILSQKGMSNIQVGCATPDQLDGDKGYHVNVSYEDPIDHEITTGEKFNERVEQITSLERAAWLGRNVSERIEDIHQNCCHNIIIRLTNYQNNNEAENYCLACHHKLGEFSHYPFPHFEPLIINFEGLYDGMLSSMVSVECQLKEATNKMQAKIEENPNAPIKEVIESINEENKKSIAIRKKKKGQ